jgi:fatty acid amide hydrolase
LRCLGEKPVAEYWRLTAERTVLRRAEFAAWNTMQLDAVVCPPHLLPALPLGSSGDLTLSLSYMFRYVMLNFPCGIVPVTRVRSDETDFFGAKSNFFGNKCAAALRGSAGLPVGVQVVARPYREEVALAVMAAIESESRRSPDYPKTPIDPRAV